jgi:hypothetical protein
MITNVCFRFSKAVRDPRTFRRLPKEFVIKKKNYRYRYLDHDPFATFVIRYRSMRKSANSNNIIYRVTNYKQRRLESRVHCS